MKFLKLVAFIFLCTSTQQSFAQETINIFGIVYDGITGKPVQGAKVKFLNKDNLPIYNGKTNQDGFFKITTKLTPGREIWIEISKDGFITYREQDFIEDRGNRLEVFLSPGKETGFDKHISIQVYDKKGWKRGRRKPIEGVTVEFDIDTKVLSGVTKKDGYHLIRGNFKLAQKVIIYLKKDGYETVEIDHIYVDKRDGNKITIKLKKIKKFGFECPCMIAGGLGLALAGGMKLKSRSTYSSYEKIGDYDTRNERSTDLDTADKLNKNAGKIAIISAVVATGCALYKWVFKKKKKPTKQKSINLDLYGNFQSASIITQ